MNFYDYPNINTDPLDIFEFCVRKAITLGLMNETRNHLSWANAIFSYESNSRMRSELMSIVKHDYSVYFSEKFSYRFLEDKIRANFPYLFGLKKETDLFKLIELALNAEIAEAKSPRKLETYKVESCSLISKQEGVYLYKAILVIEKGDDPHFTEGVAFELRNASGNYQCEIVEFNYEISQLFFSSSREVYVSWDSRIILDATFNTVALKNRLAEIASEKIDDSIPLTKFITGNTEKLKSIAHGPYSEYLVEKLDDSQLKAFNASLSKDITFIWGPPGTGKSFTLASIIMALYEMEGERTAICCLSNVAVDQLANKVVDLIEVNSPDMPRGEFYRAGRTQDEKLLATDFLFPDDDESVQLRDSIDFCTRRLDRYKKKREQYSDEAIKVKARLKDLREELKVHTDYLISQVKVVFSTISNFVISSRLKDSSFDNLVIDEASMLAEPQLIALAKNVTKRIILVGDFQQLSPITTAGIPVLKKNVFRLCGINIDNTSHPALHQLLNQRRSNPKLVDVINSTFYADRLIAKNGRNHPVVARAPFSGCVIGMKCVKGKVRFTKGGTRQNEENAKVVLDMLDTYSKDVEATFSIGVITPYTGQVSELKYLFFKRHYDDYFQERVRIGTVHTFQGSECDVIIFDMVDSDTFEEGEAYVGKIYEREQGEELLNVAISRARHKLIVVCDPDYIANPPGDKLSHKSYEIFKKLLDYKNTME